MRELEHETFGGRWPYEPRFVEVGDVRLHHVDVGEGDAVVMLHGNPTWGVVYRRFIERLSGQYRCIVPDHMGFGKSDAPQQATYDLATHVDNLEAVLGSIGIDRCALVVQDWGGPIGLALAARKPELISKLVVLNSWASVYPEGTELYPLLAMFRQPVTGPALLRSLNLFVESYLPSGMYHQEKIPEIMDLYRRPLCDWSSRIGTASFPSDIPVGKDHPSAPEMERADRARRRLEAPVLVVWGTQDPDFEEAELDGWVAAVPHADVHRVDTAGHFVQEDEPELAVDLVERFLAHG